MARKKEATRWDLFSRREWLALFGDRTVMTDLMMAIFAGLYRSYDHSGRAKGIASALHTEYRALNAAVGWAGGKLREQKGKVKGRKPWEYVFDGEETEDGAYLWIMKPSALAAWREMKEADLSLFQKMEGILRDDESADGEERNLFAASPKETVAAVRRALGKEEAFQRKSLPKHPCCAVCGASRLSLLRAVPYGEETKGKGLLFCPTHGALFAAHLITFSAKRKLLLSPALSDEEKTLWGLTEGMPARSRFSDRRMAQHRKVFYKEGESS